MNRNDYLDLVRQHAEASGGSIGLRRFCRETRLPEKHFIRLGFANWNAVMQAAQLPQSSFIRPCFNQNHAVAAFADLAIRLQKWPTEAELMLEKIRDKDFPSLHVIRRLARTDALSQEVLARCAGREELVALVACAKSKIPEPEDSPGSNHVVGYVYMMRSGQRCKIGHTTSPTRRHREVRLDLPDPTDLVHTIATDDPAGIERYWHRRFEAKRIRDTEFFELDRSDVLAFKARKYQ